MYTHIHIYIHTNTIIRHVYVEEIHEKPFDLSMFPFIFPFSLDFARQIAAFVVNDTVMGGRSDSEVLTSQAGWVNGMSDKDLSIKEVDLTKIVIQPIQPPQKSDRHEAW